MRTILIKASLKYKYLTSIKILINEKFVINDPKKLINDKLLNDLDMIKYILKYYSENIPYDLDI